MLQKIKLTFMVFMLALSIPVAAFADTAADVTSLWTAFDLSAVQIQIVAVFLLLIGIGLVSLAYTYINAMRHKAKGAIR